MPTIDQSNAVQSFLSLIAADAADVLVGNLQMGRLVNRNYDKLVAEQGQKVSIKIPPIMTSSNLAEGGSLAFQAPEPGFAEVTLAYHRVVAFSVSDMAKVLRGDMAVKDYVTPSMVALAEDVERDILSQYAFLAQTAGSSSSAISESAIDAAEKQLAINKVPESMTRWCAMHPDPYSTLRNVSRLSEMQTIGSGDAIITGQVGRLKNVNIFRSQYAIKDSSNVYHSPVFVPDAFVLVTRPMPRATLATVTMLDVSYRGFNFRLTATFNHNQMAENISLDMLYGVGVFRPNFGVDMVSNG